MKLNGRKGEAKNASPFFLSKNQLSTLTADKKLMLKFKNKGCKLSQELMNYVASLIENIAAKGLTLSDEKEIPYGIQLIFSKGSDKININVYFSKKKGISTVIGGSQKNKLRNIMENILYDTPLSKESEKALHSWTSWCGSDESGKGDYFGALVVCGFVCSEEIVPELKKLGVRDSKALKNNDIEKIAKAIYAKYKDRIEVLKLKPEKYNELYAKFRDQGKKLNEMLAWMHSRVILNLYNKKKFDGALIDQFANINVIKRSVKDINKLNLKTATKAESDTGVAAASIIARYHFLEEMKNMRIKYKIDFPLGAGSKVITIGKKFIEKFDKNLLHLVAKKHFSTTEKIGGNL